MSWWRTFWVVWGNIKRNRRAFVMASVGLIVGVATGTFFVALGAGIQSNVLNKIYPVNQIEVEPKTVGLMGLREQVVAANRLGNATVEEFRSLAGVTQVYPKLRSKLQARLWGGKSLFGYDARTEAFFDGLDARLLHPELRQMERVDEKRQQRTLKRRRQVECRQLEDCPLGQDCESGRCVAIEYWKRFRDRGLQLPCDARAEATFCPQGQMCSVGICRTGCGDSDPCGQGEACVADPMCGPEDAECASICLPTCSASGGCPEIDQRCLSAGDGPAVCTPTPCRMKQARDQMSDRQSEWRGEVVGTCSNGVPWGDPACEVMPCPRGTYCAGRSVASATGHCEQPIPVLLSPFLVEVFNSSVAESLGLQRLDGVDALLGFQFRLLLGDSYFADDLPRSVQAVKRAEIVGFSSKALDFGVTMPIDYVRAINTRYKGRDAANRFSTFILETANNEDVAALIAATQERGFELARKSQDARKAADLLFILTAVFAFISVVIAAVAAVNIANTFLMMVAERRYEIGIMRAVGARRADIRRIVFLEAVCLGVFGGILGELVSFGLSRAVNALAVEHLQVAMSKPDDFFNYDPAMLVGAIGIAVVFCVIGALAPAQRAAATDPAVVLTS